MGGNIFEIKEEHIEELDRLSEDDISCEHPFRGQVDWIEDVEDRQEEVRYFLKNLEESCNGFCSSLSDEEGSFSFTEGFKKAYFAEKYERFEKAVNELRANMSVKCFSDATLDVVMGRMNEAYQEEYGTYVIGDYQELRTLDNFIRHASVGVTYYVGGVMWYHY